MWKCALSCSNLEFYLSSTCTVVKSGRAFFFFKFQSGLQALFHHLKCLTWLLILENTRDMFRSAYFLRTVAHKPHTVWFMSDLLLPEVLNVFPNALNLLFWRNELKAPMRKWEMRVLNLNLINEPIRSVVCVKQNSQRESQKPGEKRTEHSECMAFDILDSRFNYICVWRISFIQRASGSYIFRKYILMWK